MAELETENEKTQLSSKINVLNKNVKTLIFSIDKLMEKLGKPVVEKTPEEEKEKGWGAPKAISLAKDKDAQKSNTTN